MLYKHICIKDVVGTYTYLYYLSHLRKNIEMCLNMYIHIYCIILYIYIERGNIYIYINPPCGIKPADTSARYVQNHTESNKCLVYFFYNAQIPVGLHTSHELRHLIPSSKGAGEKRSKSHRHSYVSWAFVGQRRRRKPYPEMIWNAWLLPLSIYGPPSLTNRKKRGWSRSAQS
jgi:hypothetical protein